MKITSVHGTDLANGKWRRKATRAISAYIKKAKENLVNSSLPLAV